jgi:hypothetical protein
MTDSQDRHGDVDITIGTDTRHASLPGVYEVDVPFGAWPLIEAGWISPAAAEQLRAEATNRVTEVDRQWCANIDVATGGNLEEAVAATISQLRTELATVQEMYETERRKRELAQSDRDVAQVERDALLPVAEAANAWRAEMGGPTFPHGVVVVTPEFNLMVAVDLWTEKTEAGP